MPMILDYQCPMVVIWKWYELLHKQCAITVLRMELFCQPICRAMSLSPWTVTIWGTFHRMSFMALHWLQLTTSQQRPDTAGFLWYISASPSRLIYNHTSSWILLENDGPPCLERVQRWELAMANCDHFQHPSAPICHEWCWWSHVFVHFHLEGHHRTNYS